ncbi:MAG: penicillin-binding protein 2 [Phycisphaerales bacterium]|nr:penicillin-binding protein 2 [Phycisphaerales bacterium]
MLNFSPIRALVVMGVVIASFVGLMGRVAYLQTYGAQQLVRRADRQQHMIERLPARRGTVFDSVGNLLAGTVQSKTVYADPKFMFQSYQEEGRSLVRMDDDVAKLARILDKDAFEISQLLNDRHEARFVKIAEHLDDNSCKAIEALDMPGIGLMPASERYYPMGSIAAHILGTVGGDGSGLEGLELKYEKTLAGRDGSKRTLKDARRRGIFVAAEDYLPPDHGKHLILTIDANIQMIAEQELAASCEQYNAKRGEVVVMNPQTGEVLAMANWPTFNPQNPEDSTMETRRNRSITDPYEPGSTFKPFMVGPALQWGITRVNEVWPIKAISYYAPSHRTVTDVHFYGPLSTWDVLVKSSNIGMSMLAERMENPRIYKAITTFRFGSKTGIELPGEDPGLVYPLKRWGRKSTESVAQGYEVMVTPLQLARAMCAYANGGRIVQPHVIKGVLDANGTVVTRSSPTDLKLLPEAVDPVTAAEVRRVLCDVPIRGTARGARSGIWNVFGKTGTAHISEGKKGYSPTRFNSSFIGGAPAEDPRLVIAMVVHDPERKLGHYGGTVTAPAAVRTLERALAYMQVSASPDLPLPPPQIAGVLVNYDPKVYRRPPIKGPQATASVQE